jgi:hypothetical protein
MASNAQATANVASTGSGPLSRQALGLIVGLVVQFGLGMAVNVYGKLPASDKGKNVGSAFIRAISKGPVSLSIHAILGVILILGSIGVIVAGIRFQRRVIAILGGVGVLLLIGAAMSGATFVGATPNSSQANSASLSMALMAGLTIIDYAVVLFLAKSD